MHKKLIKGLALATMTSVTAPMYAADYDIDPAHTFVEFRIQHLGYSWLYGRFNGISGSFSHDSANPTASSISVQIQAASVDTNHAERDKHIRSADFLDVGQYATASFESTGYSGSDAEGVMEGNLTLHGVTKPVKINVKKVGEGKDPWGGYRAGFIGTMTLARSDFGVTYDLGPPSETMEFDLNIEGIRK